MHEILKNGCEIIRGHMVEVGLMMTELPGKPEAWLWWCEGQSVVGDQGMLWGSRDKAVKRVNVWLDGIGLRLHGSQIFSKEEWAEREKKIQLFSSEGFWQEVREATERDKESFDD